LKFISGCELQSELDFFGGWSGMTFIGSSLLLVSDLSAWLLIADPLSLCEKRHVTGTIGWLFNSNKKSLRAAGYGDIEAVSYSKRQNQLLLSHESYSSGIFVGDLKNDDISSVPFKLLTDVPRKLHDLPKGRGLEAISWVNVKKNRPLILALAERDPEKNREAVPGWILDANGKSVQAFSFAVEPGYDVSDMAYEENCGLFVLERKLSWLGRFFVKLNRVDIDGSLVKNEWPSETIFAGDSSGSLIDNMEGIAVSYNDNECKVAIVSDSNFIKLQKTTLLVFSFSPK
ncbi:esterase-like activity of phytase family protein, partial [Methylophilus sp.]